MKKSCLADKLVSPYFPPPQPPREVDELESTRDYLMEGGQTVMQGQTIYNPVRCKNSAVLFSRLQDQPTQARITTPDCFPSTPSTPGTRVTMVPFQWSSLSEFLEYVRSNVSDSSLPFITTVFQDIRKAVAKVSRGVMDMPCVSCIRDQVTRVTHFFIRGLEAEGINMYNEMCYEECEYLLILEERIEEGLMYLEEKRTETFKVGFRSAITSRFQSISIWL